MMFGFGFIKEGIIIYRNNPEEKDEEERITKCPLPNS